MRSSISSHHPHEGNPIPPHASIPLWRRMCSLLVTIAYIHACVIPTPVKAHPTFDVVFDSIRPFLKSIEDSDREDGSASPVFETRVLGTPLSFLSSTSLLSESDDEASDAKGVMGDQACEGSVWELMVRGRTEPFVVRIGQKKTVSFGDGHTLELGLSRDGIEVYNFCGTTLSSPFLPVIVPVGGRVVAREVNVGTLTASGDVHAHFLHADTLSGGGRVCVDRLTASSLRLDEGSTLCGFDDATKVPEEQGVRVLTGREVTLAGTARIHEATIFQCTVSGVLAGSLIRGDSLQVLTGGAIAPLLDGVLKLHQQSEIALDPGARVEADFLEIGLRTSPSLLKIRNAGSLTATMIATHCAHMSNESGGLVEAACSQGTQERASEITVQGSWNNRGVIKGSSITLGGTTSGSSSSSEERSEHTPQYVNESTGTISAHDLTLPLQGRGVVDNHGVIRAHTLHSVRHRSDVPVGNDAPALVTSMSLTRLKNYADLSFSHINAVCSFAAEENPTGNFPEQIIESLGGESHIHIPTLPEKIPGSWTRHGHVYVKTLRTSLEALVHASEAATDPWLSSTDDTIDRGEIVGEKPSFPGVVVTDRLYVDVGEATDLTTPLVSSAHVILHRSGANTQDISSRLDAAYGLAKAREASMNIPGLSSGSGAITDSAGSAPARDDVYEGLRASALDPEGMAMPAGPDFHIRADIRAGKGLALYLGNRLVRIGDNVATTYPQMESGCGALSLLVGALDFQSGLIAAVEGGGFHTLNDQRLGSNASRDPTKQTTLYGNDLFCTVSEAGDVQEKYLHTWLESQGVWSREWRVISSQHHQRGNLLGAVDSLTVNAENNGGFAVSWEQNIGGPPYGYDNIYKECPTTPKSVFEIHGRMGMTFARAVNLGIALLGTDFIADIRATSAHAHILLNAHNGGNPRPYYLSKDEVCWYMGGWRAGSERYRYTHKRHLGTAQTEFSSSSGLIFQADNVGLGGVCVGPQVRIIHDELMAIGGVGYMKTRQPFVRLDTLFNPSSPLVLTPAPGDGSLVHRLRYPLKMATPQVNWPFYYKGKFSHTQPTGVPLLMDPHFLGLLTGTAINQAGFPGMHLVFNHTDSQANLLGSNAHGLVDVITRRLPELNGDPQLLGDGSVDEGAGTPDTLASVSGSDVLATGAALSALLRQGVPEFFDQASGWWVYDETVQALIPVIATAPQATDLGSGQRAAEILVPEGKGNHLALIPQRKESRASLRAIHTRAPRTLLASGAELIDESQRVVFTHASGHGRTRYERVHVSHVGSLHETTGASGPVVAALGDEGRVMTHGPVGYASRGPVLLAGAGGVYSSATEDTDQVMSYGKKHQSYTKSVKTQGIQLLDGTPGLVVAGSGSVLAGVSLAGGTLGLLCDTAVVSGSSHRHEHQETQVKRGALQTRVRTHNAGFHRHRPVGGRVVALGAVTIDDIHSPNAPRGVGVSADALVSVGSRGVLATVDRGIDTLDHTLRALGLGGGASGFMSSTVRSRLSRLRGGVDLITTRMGDGTGVMYPVESAPVMMPVYDSHYDRRHTRRRAGYAVSTAAGLAVGLLTQGLGVSEGLAGILGTSGSVSSGIAGGITAAASTITANSIGSGSLGQGIGSTFGRDGLRGMGVGALSAGVLDGLGVTGPSVTFGSRVRASAVKVPVTTGLEIGIGRRDPVEAFRSGVTGGVVDVFGGTAAQAIGGAYIPGSGQSGLGYVSHKLLHGALGASGGAILGRDDPLRGALSGGIGAIIGEMVIEATAPDPVVEVGRIREEIRRDKPWLSSEHVSREALRRYESQVRFHRDVAQVLSTLGAGVGGNPAVASQMSANALDNNFIVTTLLVAGGLCTLYETYESYQRAGVSGAATTLTQAAVLSLLGAQAFKGVVCVGGKVFARVGPQLVELSQPALRSLAQSPVGQKFFKSGVEVVGSTGDMRWATTVAHYIRDMEVRSGFRFMQPQKTALANALRTGTFKKLDPVAKQMHTNQFTRSTRNRLISEWESNTGQVWPRQMRLIKGEMKNVKVDAHHIIPQQVGGPHQWWNMKPLEFGRHHQGGVHGARAPLRRLLDKVE
ncbi:MAG: hypothetical protein H6849_00885 [Alphaproteobacteria bacterium]|nr:MAG: hypothetical protein H6849_00885 [Alphaproteobacteria bacterium]